MRWTIRHGWRRHAFRLTALAVTVALLASTTSVRAADAPPSNLDLLYQMTSEVAEELYAKFGPELGGRPIQLRAFGSGDDYTFVQNVFTSVLTSHDVRTIAVPPSAPAVARPTTGGATSGATIDPTTGANIDPNAGTTNPAPATGGTSTLPTIPTTDVPNKVVLTYQNVAFGVAYPDVYRSHLVGGKRVKRRADVRVHATVTDGSSGEVLWVGEAARERADEFEYDDSARVEQGQYQFARPVLPGGGWGKYAEPVFVTGIIVGLIYLFFSNQSDN